MSDSSKRGPRRPEGFSAVARDLAGQAAPFDFASSVIAGLLLGLGIDWLAGTSPIFTIVCIVAGFVSGFVRLWAASAVIEEQAKERRDV